MRRLLSSLALAAAMVFAPRVADAAITFDFASICTANCPFIGLADNDPISASITFADTAIVANGVVTRADILDFTIDFGTVEITLATAAGFGFQGTLNAAADAFVGLWSFNAGETVDPVVGDVASFGAIGVLVGQGFCGAVPLCTGGNIVDFALGEGAGLELRDVVAVPEPGTLALFGAALAGLALARRRKAA